MGIFVDKHRMEILWNAKMQQLVFHALIFVGIVAEFTVTVPQMIVANLAERVILPCSYSTDSNSSNFTLNWFEASSDPSKDLQMLYHYIPGIVEVSKKTWISRENISLVIDALSLQDTRTKCCNITIEEESKGQCIDLYSPGVPPDNLHCYYERQLVNNGSRVIIKQRRLSLYCGYDSIPLRADIVLYEKGQSSPLQTEDGSSAIEVDGQYSSTMHIDREVSGYETLLVQYEGGNWTMLLVLHLFYIGFPDDALQCWDDNNKLLSNGTTLEGTTLRISCSYTGVFPAADLILYKNTQQVDFIDRNLAIRENDSYSLGISINVPIRTSSDYTIMANLGYYNRKFILHVFYREPDPAHTTFTYLPPGPGKPDRPTIPFVTPTFYPPSVTMETEAPQTAQPQIDEEDCGCYLKTTGLGVGLMILFCSIVLLLISITCRTSMHKNKKKMTDMFRRVYGEVDTAMTK